MNETSTGDITAPTGPYQPLIFAKMAAIMEEVPAIAKGQQNKEQGYQFRGIDDVYQALHPLFVKHQVFITAEVLDSEYVQAPRGRNQNIATDARLRVRYTFSTTDGSFVTSTVMGESRDFADKATNQAMSTAIKTCLLQTFLIPLEDGSDPDERSPLIESHQPATPATVEEVPDQNEITRRHENQVKVELIELFGNDKSAAEWWMSHKGQTPDDILRLAKESIGQ